MTYHYRRSDEDYSVQPNSSGTEMSPAYHMSIMDGIEKYVRDLHDQPTQELIQSWASSTNLVEALRRYQEGDASALGDPDRAIFADVSDMPKSLAEAFALSRSLESKWLSMPESIRTKFGNNISDFLKAYDSGKIRFENPVKKVTQETKGDSHES